MTIAFYEDSFGPTGWEVSPSKIYKPLKFPGGEAHVVDGQQPLPRGEQVAWVPGADADSLMQLAMWADLCHRRDLRTVAVIPYLPGARQDRGAPLGAKVYADFINSMNIDRIICFDPHSDVMPALLDRCRAVPLHEHPQWFARQRPWDDVVGIIVPDVGARRRAEGVAAALGGVPLYQASKHRDFATGKLSGFECEPIALPNGKRLLVVDDICDGGGTFIGLAQTLGLPRESLSLWVSHGIFSKGTKDLFKHYSIIATTDSHPGSHELTTEVNVSHLFHFLYSRR